MSGVITAAAITAGGAYAASENARKKQKGISAPQVADPRTPGGVSTARGGGFYVDPRTGRTVFASGQGGAGGTSIDKYRERMMMDQLMGGGDSVGFEIGNQIKEAQARLDRYKSGSGAVTKLNAAEQLGAEWVDANGNVKDPSKVNYMDEMNSGSDLYKRFLSDTHGGDYGKGAQHEKFSKWTQDAWKNNIQAKHDKYQNDLRTQEDSAKMNTEEQAAAQRQLDELLGIQGQLGGMRESMSSNPLIQMMSQQTGRRSRAGGPAGGGAPVGEGGTGGAGPMPIPGGAGGPTSQVGGQNYDIAFSDDRKGQMRGLANENFAKAGEDQPWMAGVGTNWANPSVADLGPGGSALESMLSMRRPGVMSNEKINAPGLDTAGLGSFAQFLKGQTTNQFEQEDQLARERAAAGGAGFGSQSAIAGLQRRRSLNDALVGNEASVFQLGRDMNDKNFAQRLGAASHNLDVDKANQDYSLDFDASQSRNALAMDQLKNSAFQRGFDATRLNADLGQQFWGRGMDAFGAETGLDQRDIENNFRNETLGMAQDEGAMNNRLRMLDWIRGGDTTRFNQDMISRQGDLGEMQFGNQVGGNYLQQLLEAELARAGMTSSADMANQQVESGNNSALMALIASLGGSVVSGLGAKAAAKAAAKAGK